MQFEQTQQSWPRREATGTDTDSVSSHSTGTNGTEPIVTIPMNKQGKRYTMKQAFSAWFDHKAEILADASNSVKTGENYKLAKPQQLYHLDIYHANFGEGTPALEADEAAENGDWDAPEAAAKAPEKARMTPPPNLTRPAPVEAVEPAQTLLQPEAISWVYLDPSGNEQGPFTGDMMQEWLSEGYLSLDLRIRRQEETRFQTLKSFCEHVHNFVQPFKVPLPRVPEPAPEPVQEPFPNAFHQLPDGPAPGDASGFRGNANVNVNGSGFQNGGPQLAFGSNLYSQLMPNGGLGAANIRTPSANPLYDFMGPADYPLMNAPYSAGGQFGMDAMNPNLSFSQLHMPSLLQQQIQSQQPQLSRSSSGWGLDNPLQGSLPSTPTTAAPVPLGMGQAGLGQSGLGQSGSMSPWVNRVQTMSRVSSPFVPNSTLGSGAGEKADDNLLLDIHNSMVSGILRDEDHGRALASDLLADFSSNPAAYPAAEAAEAPEVKKDAAKASKSKQAGTQAPVAEAPKAKTDARESAPAPVAAPAAAPVAELPTDFGEPEAETAAPVEPEAETSKSEEPVSAQPAAASAPAPAPWAVSKAKQEAPPLTLKQIQELEAERLQREKQLKAEMRQEIALANAIAASKLEEKVPEKVTFNWATSSLAPSAKKTLAEIQREEEAEAARSRASKMSVNSASKISLATALASTPVKEEAGGAWTTVTAKKPVLKKQTSVASQGNISYSSLTGAINPQALRSVSSTAVPTSTINTQAIKEDFLVWARSAMTNLYPSVSKNDLLEVFTTLPLHSESAQLISETIYSSSATMDGRRFSQEFMKKRQQVEKQVGPSAPESWSSAIISSADKVATVDDDGWSTSVKSKKKGRKN